MIEHLFGSNTRVKLLHVFYTSPNRSFYVREITRKIDEQINSVRRELSNLLKIGIISSSTSGNRLYYEVNQKHPHYEALRSIFSNIDSKKEVVINPEADLAAQFQALGSIDYAVLTGIFTRDNVAPVDVLIVGDVNRTQLDKLINKLQIEEGHELRYTVLSRDNFDYRKNLNDRFLTSVLDAKKTILIDKVSDEKKEKDVKVSDNDGGEDKKKSKKDQKSESKKKLKKKE